MKQNCAYLLLENVNFTESETLTPDNVTTAQYTLIQKNGKIFKFPIQKSNIECLRKIYAAESSRPNKTDAEMCDYINVFKIETLHVNPYTKHGYVAIMLPVQINTESLIRDATLGWKEIH